MSKQELEKRITELEGRIDMIYDQYDLVMGLLGKTIHERIKNDYKREREESNKGI